MVKCFRRIPSIILTAVLALAVLGGCSENVTLFGPSSQAVAYTIVTIEDGEVLRPNSEIAFSLSINDIENGVIPDSAELEVTNVFGEAVAAAGYDDLPTVPEERHTLLLDGLIEGVYFMDLRLFYGLEVTDFVERQFFVLSETLNIAETIVYPPTVEPDSLAIAQAALVNGEFYNPYARWLIDGALVAEGYWSEGAETVRFDTPQEDGVFFLNVEVFPFGPEEGVDVARTAPIVHRGSVYVSSERTPGPGELGPNDQFIDLYHFAGNLRNAAPEWGNTGESRFLGTPQVLIEEEVFGYYLDGTSSIEFDRSILPNADRGLTAEIVILPFTLSQGMTLFSSETESGERIWLGNDGNGVFSLVYEDAVGEEATYMVPLLYREEREALRLSVLISSIGDTYFVTILDRGRPIAPLTIQRVPLETADEEEAEEDDDTILSAQSGRTVIGCDGGVHGIVDEFGIAAMAPEVLLLEVRDRYHKALLDEYGFALLLSDALIDVERGRERSYTVADTGENGARFAFEPVMTGFPLTVDVTVDGGDPQSVTKEEGDSPAVSIDLPPASTDVEVTIGAPESDISILNLFIVQNESQ